jgi:glycosyltransferase involved in cell wall biosynthesis
VLPVKIAIIENDIIATNTIRGKLCRELLTQGHDVTVLTSGTPESLALARSKGFKVIDIGGSTQNLLDIGRYLQKLRRELKRLAPDVCLTFTIRPALWGNLVTRQLGIKTITNITGIGPLFERKDFAYRSARALYNVALQKTARVVFQNGDDMKIFLSKGFIRANRAIQVPGSGIDHAHYAPMVKTRTDEGFEFLFVGRLVRDKGVGEYARAASLLRERGLRVTCRIVGPIWNQNLRDNTVTREDLAAWEASGAIAYAGETQDVKPFIANADCVVLPSYREGTSNVLLEASSMARPCITTNTTGCKEIVEDGVTGFLCEVANARDLADKMQKMAELPAEARARMGAAARQKVIREFDKRIVIDAYLLAIEQVVKESA